MSDEENDPREAMLKRHRTEKKDLQAQIQALKKSVPKGDKKKKKEITENIAQLEEDLNTRHKKELDELQSNGTEENRLAISKNLFYLISQYHTDQDYQTSINSQYP